ncbi:hypothetical protein FHS26_003748 [Rhizobium pisi]|uniref:Uncharacterized protein n=1 Tax=Rhizobium pisi TaxID=574561 RepID=A0A3R9BJ57_9HYPH|nr:hypothetical protein [Rhizobium pisi]MBB3136001.1 hypothetical protein [Rhizobium pisi]RSB75859.1 hypothetical protein EFD55_18790 [Rhizobium pisi]TCA55264.1 hypothetical protein E0J16_16270 [Rhizobium pisi]
MKTPQRNFVVEIKSKGRRSAVRQGSIWGSTDLKAFARQAASVAPQLFEDGQKADVTVEDIVVAPAVENAPVAGPILAPVAETSDAIAAIAVATVEKRSEPQELAVVEVVAKAAVATRQPRRSGITGRQSPTRPKDGDKVGTSVTSHLASLSEASIDELSALEAENRRLKTLLADRLRQQNLRLRMMLHRFGAA